MLSTRLPKLKLGEDGAGDGAGAFGAAGFVDGGIVDAFLAAVCMLEKKELVGLAAELTGVLSFATVAVVPLAVDLDPTVLSGLRATAVLEAGSALPETLLDASLLVGPLAASAFALFTPAVAGLIAASGVLDARVFATSLSLDKPDFAGEDDFDVAGLRVPLALTEETTRGLPGPF
jgi:hypothetical protein